MIYISLMTEGKLWKVPIKCEYND